MPLKGLLFLSPGIHFHQLYSIKTVIKAALNLYHFFNDGNYSDILTVLLRVNKHTISYLFPTVPTQYIESKKFTSEQPITMFILKTILANKILVCPFRFELQPDLQILLAEQSQFLNLQTAQT